MSELVTHTQIRRLERPTHGRILGGVCAGLGRYFELNASFFRLGFVVLTLLGGAGVLVYLAALVVIPDEQKEQSFAEQVVAERRERPWPLFALGVAGVAAAVLLSHATVWPAAGAGWVVLLAAGLIVLWASRGERRAGRILRLALGMLALVVALVVAAVIAAFSWFDVSLGSGTGDRTYTPVAAAAVQPSYHLGIGRLELDLPSIPAGSAPIHLDARVDLGKLRIVVPANTPVSVNAHVKAGEIAVFRQTTSGRNADLTTGAGGVTIDARVGAGRIEVVRAR